MNIKKLAGIIAGGAQVLPLYTGQVATAVRVPDLLSALPGSRGFRTRHYARANIVNNMQIAFPGWYVETNNAETTAADATFKAAIEYPIGVTSTPVTWAAASSIAVTGGTTSGLSDAIPVSIPVGQPFMVRTFYTNATNIIYAGKGSQDTVNGEQQRSGASDETAAVGAMTSGSSVATGVLTPILMVAPITQPAVLLLGDSRVVGSGSVSANDAFTGVSGDRGETPRSVGPWFGYSMVAVQGTSAQNYVGAAHALRNALQTYFSTVICNYGINDITGSARTPAQTLADLKTIAGYFPGKKFYQCTIAPRTTSSDSWATIANQTLNANSAGIATLNGLIRAAPVEFTGYYELADVVESSRDSGKWIVNGVANYATADGLHETTAANLLIQASGIIGQGTIRG